MFGVDPQLPVDALMGRKLGAEMTHDWLVVHQKRLKEAHERAKAYAEKKQQIILNFPMIKCIAPPLRLARSYT